MIGRFNTIGDPNILGAEEIKQVLTLLRVSKDTSIPQLDQLFMKGLKTL